MGNKWPTQDRRARGKNRMVEQINESVTNQPAISWTESIKWGVKTPAIVHGWVRNDVEKQ